jgi:hypothetical protein
MKVGVNTGFAEAMTYTQFTAMSVTVSISDSKMTVSQREAGLLAPKMVGSVRTYRKSKTWHSPRDVSLGRWCR